MFELCITRYTCTYVPIHVQYACITSEPFYHAWKYFAILSNASQYLCKNVFLLILLFKGHCCLCTLSNKKGHKRPGVLEAWTVAAPPCDAAQPAADAVPSPRLAPSALSSGLLQHGFLAPSGLLRPASWTPRPSGLPAASNTRPSLRTVPAGASLQAVAGLQKPQHFGKHIMRPYYLLSIGSC